MKFKIGDEIESFNNKKFYMRAIIIDIVKDEYVYRFTKHETSKEIGKCFSFPISRIDVECFNYTEAKNKSLIKKYLGVDNEV